MVTSPALPASEADSEKLPGSDMAVDPPAEQQSYSRGLETPPSVRARTATPPSGGEGMEEDEVGETPPGAEESPAGWRIITSLFRRGT